VDVHGDQGPVGVPDVQEGTTFESPKSPFHIALDTSLPDSPSIESLASSQHSFATVTSPQDSNWDQPFQGDILAVKLPDSPTLARASSSTLGSSPGQRGDSVYDSKFQALLVCRSALLTLVTVNPERSVPVSKEPASPIETGLSEEDAWPPSPVRTRTPSAALYPRLQCRLCHADPCVETTATMCGHVFCYRYV
jgi:hypothetical protein